MTSGTPKVHPSIKARKKLAKPVRNNFFGTLKTNPKFAGVRGTVNQEKWSNLGKNSGLSGTWPYPGPVSQEVVAWKKTAHSPAQVLAGECGERERPHLHRILLVCWWLPRRLAQGLAFTSPHLELSQCWDGHWWWGGCTEIMYRQKYQLLLPGAISKSWGKQWLTNRLRGKAGK